MLEDQRKLGSYVRDIGSAGSLIICTKSQYFILNINQPFIINQLITQTFKFKISNEITRVMNADLAEVSKRYGAVGHPLRNRSGSRSSNSRDGSQLRPDPGRYTKYLSLRNRKIVEQNYHRGSRHEDSSSSPNNSASRRSPEPMPEPISQPLQSCLKSTSSRVSDLRNHASVEQLQHASAHSPLRQKSRSSLERSEHSSEVHHSFDDRRSREKQDAQNIVVEEEKRRSLSLSGSSRKRSPIPVFQPTQEDPEEEEESQNRQQQLAEEMQQKHEPRHPQQIGARNREQFKSTTEAESSEFNFDFDKDAGASCHNRSYVNTTEKSERESVKARNRADTEKSYYKPNSLAVAQARLMSQRNERNSINAYEDELRASARQAVQTGSSIGIEDESSSDKEEGSGYVIDYEQVLRENNRKVQERRSPPKRFRHEIGENTILEQTQEAQETSTDQDLIEVENATREITLASQHEEVRAITRRRGSRDSPTITDEDEQQQHANAEYNIGAMSTANYAEPILTFENREQQHTDISSPAQMQRIHSVQNSSTQHTEQNNYVPMASDDCLTPLMEQDSKSEYDMETSNKKLRARNREIDEEFEKQCYGSQLPSSQLVVTCIIRKPMETVGIYSKYKSMHSGSTATVGLGKDVIGQAKGSRGNSVGSLINRKGGILNRSHNGLDVSKSNNRSAGRLRAASQEARGNNQSGGSTKNRNSGTSKAAPAGAMGSMPNAYRHPHILTTSRPSRFVLRSPAGLQAQLMNILLRTEQDVNHCQLAFDEHGIQSKQKGHRSMKVFEFDNCVGETKGHSLALGLDSNLRWVTTSQTALQSKSNPGSPKNVIFMFGQTDALKSQLLNVTQSNSMINHCISAKDIKFLRVSTYHLGQEYLLAHKTFGSKQQMRREIGMEIREAFRERDLNAKKVALKLSTYSKTIKAEEVKRASHLLIQLDDIVIIDLADIDNLKDPSMAKKTSADFAVVTNAILAMSTYYKDHNFGKVDEDRLAPYRDLSSLRAGSLSFKNQIARLVTRRSRVLLLCCVTQCSVAATQAVDYCHKIRSYFHGSATELEQPTQTPTPTRRLLQARGDISMDTDQNVNAFRQLGGLISEVSKARLFIDKVFANKQRGEPLKRSRNQLKEMVACLRDDVSDLLNSLSANNDGYVHELKKIREMLQAEIYYMRDKVTAMRSIGRKNSIGGSSHKSGGGYHAHCTLPKSTVLTAQQQHTQQTILSKQGIRKQSSSGNLQNQRPGSQSSLHDHSASNSRPQSSRNMHRQRLPHQQPYQQQQARKSSRSQGKSQSQSRPGAQSKTTNLNDHMTPISHAQLFSNQEPAFSGRQSGSRRKDQSAQKSSGSAHHKNEQLSTVGPATCYNGERTQASHRSSQRQREQQAQVMSLSGSRNRVGNIIDDNAASMMLGGRAFSSKTTTHQSTTNKHHQQQNQQARTQTTTTVDDRKRHHTDMSGVKLSSNLESTMPLVKTEALHQEIYQIKEQLRKAIVFGEEQVDKRKKAEENCIVLTHKLSQKEGDLRQVETKVTDLEDRIVAKDQIIHSLESQMQFLKEKEVETRQMMNSHYKEPPQVINSVTSAQKNPMPVDLDALREEKAQTDQMNKEILGQISMLKEALSAFQSQEHANKKILKHQSTKDQEMEELKQQVRQLMQMNGATRLSANDDDEEVEIRQKLEELEQVKERYREEALQLRQQMRQQRNKSNSKSRERRRSASSNKGRKRDRSNERESVHLHQKIAAVNSNNKGVFTSSQNIQHQQDGSPDHPAPQQKSLNSIKSMIRDFKEQRKGLLRTTSSREALSQASKAAISVYKRGTNQTSQNLNRQRSSHSRENDDREPVRQHRPSGYAQLNGHFR